MSDISGKNQCAEPVELVELVELVDLKQANEKGEENVLLFPVWGSRVLTVLTFRSKMSGAFGPETLGTLCTNNFLMPTAFNPSNQGHILHSHFVALWLVGPFLSVPTHLISNYYHCLFLPYTSLTWRVNGCRMSSEGFLPKNDQVSTWVHKWSVVRQRKGKVPQSLLVLVLKRTPAVDSCPILKHDLSAMGFILISEFHPNQHGIHLLPSFLDL